MTGISDQADAIVVAAGASRRMGGIDKVLAPVGGRPLLAWTLDALAAVPGVERIVICEIEPLIPKVVHGLNESRRRGRW